MGNNKEYSKKDPFSRISEKEFEIDSATRCLLAKSGEVIVCDNTDSRPERVAIDEDGWEEIGKKAGWIEDE